MKAICFCLLENLDQQSGFIKLQEQLYDTEKDLKVAVVYGNETVNSTDFCTLAPESYIMVEEQGGYAAHEAMILAYGMLKKEIMKTRPKESALYLLASWPEMCLQGTESELVLERILNESKKLRYKVYLVNCGEEDFSIEELEAE